VQLRKPSGGWKLFLWRFLPLMVILLWPWHGLGSSFSEAMADGCDAIAGLVSGSGSEIHFAAARYEPEHPWYVQMSAKNVFTDESYRVPVDTRTVAYIRVVVFLSLAMAWPFWTTKRGLTATAVSFAGLVALIGLTLVFPLLQILQIVRVLHLGVLTQSAVSIGILTLVTYPSMAFAIPSLVWLLALRIEAGAASRGDLPGSTV
jgi:hypothetical protein